MPRSSTATTTVGMSSGRVTNRNRCHAVAPSMRAASCGSSDSEVRPARRISTTIGVHCQTSMKMSGRQGGSLARPATAAAGCRSSPRSWLAKPMLGSKIRRHIMPTATGVATSGSRIATRTHFSPRNGRQSSRAIAMPRTSSKTSAPPVKIEGAGRRPARTGRCRRGLRGSCPSPTKSRIGADRALGVGQAEVDGPGHAGRRSAAPTKTMAGRGEQPLAVVVGPVGDQAGVLAEVVRRTGDSGHVCSAPRVVDRRLVPGGRWRSAPATRCVVYFSSSRIFWKRLAARCPPRQPGRCR